MAAIASLSLPARVTRARTSAVRRARAPAMTVCPAVAGRPSPKGATGLGAQLRSSSNFAAVRAAAPRVAAARRPVMVKAAAAAASPDKKSMTQTAFLGLQFLGWYAFNIYFNIYNKQVLKVFPYPWTCTLLQFAGGIVIAAAMWTFRIWKAPQFGKVEIPEVTSTSTDAEIQAAKDAEAADKKLVSVSQLKMILPLAIVHTLGNLLTNVSLGKVAVSFTHTIKAMEPFFSVLLSAVFLGDAPTMAVVLSLMPIVGGVALASISEVSFNWAGFLAAMGSNITFQSRNVLSKKLMTGDAKKGLDQINLFSIITAMSFFVLLPFTLLVEGFKLTPASFASVGDFNVTLMRLAIAAGCFHAYQLVSYIILGQVSPVTHSVGNCVKRVVVIVSSVIFFQTPVSPVNAAGTAIALAGVFAYSQVKRLQSKK